MIGEPTPTSKERNGAVHPSYINYRLKSEVSITLCCQLCSTLTNQELFEGHLCNPRIPHKKKEMALHALVIYQLSSEK